MIRYITALSLCTILTGCVDVISDKEAIARYHEEKAQSVLDEATQVANSFANSNSTQNPDVTTPDYNDYPIFVTHAKKLDELGLPYDKSNVFTTQEYEDAIAISQNYNQQKAIHGENFHSHEH
jgi:hypothetical protein